MTDVIVYSTEWCPWCHKAMDFLKKNGVPFEMRDVEKEPRYAEEMEKKSHQTGIPVIDLKGTIIVGFDQPAIMKALGMK